MGEVFAGRYELVDLLGEGGMGSVWRVWDHRERTYLAAKVLRQSAAGALLRFVREQSFRIRHQHVVTPLSWAGEDDRVLFTMRLVRGGSLAGLLGEVGALPAEWVAVLLDQLLEALGAVHNAGLIHRDVKPGNILLEPTGRLRPVVRLTDFGIAVPVTEPRLTRASQVFGTPGYLAPEVLRGADPAPRHDLYAAGMLAAEMLSGLPPRSGAGLPAAAPPGVPPALWTYALRLAAPDPRARPGSCTEARAGLAATGFLPPPPASPADPSGEVDLVDLVGPLPAGWGPDGPKPATPPVRPPRAGFTVPTATTSPAAAPPASRRPATAVAAGAAILAGLVLGAAALWPGLWAALAEAPATTPETSSGSGGERKVAAIRPSRHLDLPVHPTAAAGEACDFTEAGYRVQTARAEPVVCVRRNQAYRWQPD